MTTSLKKLQPNRLTLDEMWQVYQYLKDGTSDPLLPTFLDNVKYLVEHTSAHRMSKAIEIIYTFEKDQKIKDHLDFLTLLMRGLRKNEYFPFVIYIRKF